MDENKEREPESENIISTKDVSSPVYDQISLQMQETMQHFANMLAEVNAYPQELVSSMIDVVEGISNSIHDTLSTIDLSALVTGFANIGEVAAFTEALRQIRWPLFLIEDKEIREQIVEKCKDYNKEEFTAFISAYCENVYFKELVKKWKNNSAIQAERFPVLQEALTLHEQKAYYGATSIMMCQIYGIISDITHIMKKNNIVITSDDKKEIADLFSLKVEKIDSEKGKMLQAISIVEGRIFEWSSFADYLMDEILCSSDSKQKWNEQPLRNKICHGNQLNFGTQEHSLKAILTVDMLINLALEIKALAEHYSNKSREIV